MLNTTQVVKAIFVETGTYNDLTSRPFKTELDMGTLRSFQEATNMGQHITSSTISGIAGNVLKPSAQAQGNIAITNGWDTPRLRFILEVEFGSTSLLASTRQVVTGYTDYVGVIERGGQHIVDPNMRLFFNNSITLRSVKENSPWGGLIERQTVVDASQLLTGVYQPSFGGGVVTRSMRPEDLFVTAGLGALANANTLDTRVNFASGHIKKSNRKNTFAPEYISRVVKADQMAKASVDGEATPYDHVMDEARGQVLEGLVSDDPYLKKLMDRTNMGQEASVTYGELCAIDQHLDSIAMIMLRRQSDPVHHRGQTEHWAGSNMETLAATTLSHSVPSIMMDLMLTGVSFMATNQTLNGEYVVQIVGQKSFTSSIDMSPYLEAFTNRLKTEVLRGITNNNLITFDLTMQIDLIGETFVRISMNGQPHIDFMMPSFCDALSVPVLTQDPSDLYTLANDLTTLAENVTTPHETNMVKTYGNSSVI